MSNIPPSISDNDPRAPWNIEDQNKPNCEYCNMQMEYFDTDYDENGKEITIYQCPVCYDKKEQ